MRRTFPFFVAVWILFSTSCVAYGQSATVEKQTQTSKTRAKSGKANSVPPAFLFREILLLDDLSNLQRKKIMSAKREMHDRINLLREQRGISPLSSKSKVSSAGKYSSAILAGLLSADVPDEKADGTNTQNPAKGSINGQKVSLHFKRQIGNLKKKYLQEALNVLTPEQRKRLDNALLTEQVKSGGVMTPSQGPRP